jgi:hypothetical protein
MKIKELLIKRQEAYEPEAGQLRGIVTLIGDEGQQTLVLSPGSLSHIFEIIKEDAIAKAKLQAKQVSTAIQSAVDEPMLLGNSEVDF